MGIDDLVALGELLADPRNHGDGILEVGVHHDDVVRFRGGKAGGQGRILSEVARKVDDINVISFLVDFLHHGKGPVLGTVVDENEVYPVAFDRRKDLVDGLKVKRKNSLFVVARNDDADGFHEDISFHRRCQNCSTASPFFRDTPDSSRRILDTFRRPWDRWFRTADRSRPCGHPKASREEAWHRKEGRGRQAGR